MLGIAAGVHAQPVSEPAPAVTTTTAPPPASEPPPPSASEIAPPTPTAPSPTLAPSEPAYPVPATPTPLLEQPVTPVAAPADPLEASVKFKPGKGLDIKSADGNWSLNIRQKGQFLDETQFPGLEGAKDRSHFILRRLRLALGGTVFSKNIKYKLEFSFAGQELGRAPVAVSGATPAAEMGMVQTGREVVTQVPALDAFLEFGHIRDAVLHVGQAKVPFGRERILGDSDLQTVDRSLEDVEFNFDRDMGVELRSTDFLGLDTLRYFIGIYAAEDRNATLTSLGTGDFGLLYFARVEVLPMGGFEDTPVDFAHTSPKLSVGAAYAFVATDSISPYATTTSIAATSGSGPAEVDYKFHNFTADALFKVSGFSLLTAFHYRKAVSLPEDLFGRDGLGFVAQGHYFVSEDFPLGLAANYSTVRKVGDDSTITERSEAGGGLAWYFYDHALKIDAEFEHLWRETGDLKPDNRLRVQLSYIL
jgi:hypothetical protein